MRVLSYSLYGDQLCYQLTLLMNLGLIAKIFPGWEPWIYADRTIDPTMLKYLENRGGKLIMMDPQPARIGSLWRYDPLWHSEVEYTLVRDADELVSATHKAAVDMWIDSGKLLYTAHTVPAHARKIIAALWGIRGDWGREKLPQPKWLPEEGFTGYYGEDEDWLDNHLLPLVQHSWLKFRANKEGVMDGPEFVSIPYEHLTPYYRWSNAQFGALPQ